MNIEVYGECEGVYIHWTLEDVDVNRVPSNPRILEEMKLKQVKKFFRKFGLNAEKSRLISQKEYEANVDC